MGRAATWVFVAALVLGGDIPGSGRGGCAQAATAAIELDDVRLTVGTTRVVIPHLRAVGSPLGAQALADLFDPAQPGSLDERLGRLTASEATVPEITIAREAGAERDQPPSITLHDVDLRDVVAGRIGSLSIRQVTSAPAPDGIGSFSTGAVSAARIDLPLALRIATGTRSDVGMPLQAIVEALSVDMARLVGDKVEIRLGALQSGAIRGRPPLIAFSRLGVASKTPFAERTEGDRREIANAAWDASKSVASEHIELRDLAIDSHAGDATSIELGAFILDGAEAGKVRSAVAERFALKSNGANATIDRLALEGFDQSRLLDTLGQQALDDRPAPGADERRLTVARAIPSLADLSLRAMRIDASADDLKGNAQAGTRNVFDVPDLDFKLDPGGDGSGANSLHGRIVYDIAPDTREPGLLNLVKAGVAHLDVSLDYALGWNTGTQRTTLDHFSLAADNLGAVSVGGTFGHLAPALFDSAHADKALETMQDVELENAHLALRDAGMSAKVWALAAARAGMSVPLLKAEAKGQIEIGLLKAFGNTPTAANISSALAAFIDDPKTLSLDVKAPAGLNLRAIALSGGGRELLDVLQIDATASK